jgi:RHS repeat-associated protein
MNVNTGGTPLPLTTHCPDNLPYPTLQDFYWTYNEGTSNNGNVAISQGTYGQTFHRSFGYDALNRLSTMSDSITSQACKGLSWGYDAWGNRNQQNVTSGTCNTFNVTADANNRLPGAPYQYDAAGNMIHDASHSYTFDAENRVISVDSGATAKYVYDAEGNRVEKIVGSATTQYVHDPGGRVTLETDGNGNGGPVADYIYLAGKLVAEYKSATTYFLHSDNLGSTRLLTALNKSVFDSMDYLPFGEQVAGGSGTSHKFTEDERDPESNLDHTLFRQYSSSLARWMHPDPAGLAAVDPTNPQSWNRYAYVLDTPVTLFDPFGLCPPGNNTTVYVCADPPPPIPYVPGGCSLSVDGGPATGCGITEVGLALLPASSGWVSWGLFTSIKNSLRTIGNYIPVVCGGGLFNYGPGFRAAAGPVSVSVNPKIRIADSRSGYSEGPFTDLTVGPAAGPQGGVGYATFKGGGSETFLFGGLGFKTGVAQTSVSLFGSHVAGDPLFQNSFGLNGDLGISRTGGGVGAYLNTDSLTSCVDHNFH